MKRRFNHRVGDTVLLFEPLLWSVTLFIEDGDRIVTIVGEDVLDYDVDTVGAAVAENGRKNEARF